MLYCVTGIKILGWIFIKASDGRVKACESPLSLVLIANSLDLYNAKEVHYSLG